MRKTSAINKILFITLSNIGDVILTVPVLDYLKEKFPQSDIIVMVGPRPKEIFQNDPRIYRLIIYDKHSGLKDKIRLFNELKREDFDIIVDLRNSLFGAFLPARYKISPFLMIPKDIEHMKDKHLYKIRSLPAATESRKMRKKSKIQIQNKIGPTKNSLNIRLQDEEYINRILKENNIAKQDNNIVVVSPGARSHIKRWSKESFALLCERLLEDNRMKIILVGNQPDYNVAEYIENRCPNSILNLCNKTNIFQLDQELSIQTIMQQMRLMQNF